MSDLGRSFNEYYGMYSDWLRKCIVRRYGSQDAEDILQDTWIRFLPYHSDVPIKRPRALLLTIAANIFTDSHRKRLRRERNVPESVAGQYQAPLQSEVLLSKEIILSLPQPLRDRIVVGEMRDGAAALETLKSWNTGHPGGLSTIHANSAGDVLRRVEDLIAEVSARTPQRAIAQAVDRIVHIRRTPAGRTVEAVLGIEPSDDDGYAISLVA